MPGLGLGLGLGRHGGGVGNAPKATGGNQIVLHNGKWYHIFTSSGTFTPLSTIDCEYILVAGGGSGGKGGHSANAAGGGGAGGVLPSAAAETFLAQAYNVVVGAGGVPVIGDSYAPKDGNNTTFVTPSGTKIAKKGGMGGSRAVAGTPIESQKTNYGSGGGAGSSGNGGYNGGYGNDTESQGKNGGATQSAYPGKAAAGGGFTSAGESPSDGTTGTSGAKGGAGTFLETIWSGVTAELIGFAALVAGFAGGGNGGFSSIYIDPSTSNGGGLGGKGGRDSGNGSAATQSTGSGGGGGADTAGIGGSGADGFVIVRYAA